MILRSFIIFLLAPVMLLAQSSRTFSLSGVTLEGETGLPLRSVTVRVTGIPKGAITNADGRFSLRLPAGSYTLNFSMIGYRTEIRTVALTRDTVFAPVALTNASFQLAEVVVSAEDPGVKMMRSAIARKMRQRDSLESYTYSLYTKFVLSADTLTASRVDSKTDTTIVSIFESFSKGWYRKPDLYFNEITQRRQTANIPPEANFVAFGTNLNAYDDFVAILNENIATPFHPDALDFYDFVFDRTLRDDSLVINRVRFTPKSGARKLFSGVVYLDAKRNIPLSVEMKPNKAVQLPFDAELFYDQKFELADGKYVVPTGMRIYSTLSASFLWVISPRLDLTIETSAYDYACNVQFPDDIFDRRRVEISPLAETFDSTFWREKSVIPLRPEEAEAYNAIQRQLDNPDSSLGSNILDQVFGGVARTVARLGRRPFTGIEDMFRYNRVNGAYFGIGLRDEYFKNVEFSAKIGFGSADKRGFGEAATQVFFDEPQRFSAMLGAYRRLERRDNPYAVQQNGITILSLLFKNDYGDYYYNDGAEFSLSAGFGQLRFLRRDIFIRPTTLKVFVRTEDHRTATNHATFALFGRGKEFRVNPAIMDGTMRSLGFDVNLNFSPLRRLGNGGVHIEGEISRPSLLPSAFDFERYQFLALWRTRTLPLWKLDARLSAGYSRGNLPPQKFFSLESSASSTAGDGVFRGMGVKEFYGDRYAALTLEHNFGEVIPGVLRIPNVASFGIEFIAFGSAGWTNFSDKTRAFTATDLPSTDATSDRTYYEAGIGFNRILLFLRFDISARLSQTEKPKFLFTLGGATF